jgi:hypothetical protein
VKTVETKDAPVVRCGECGSPLMLVADKAFCTKGGCSMVRRDAKATK